MMIRLQKEIYKDWVSEKSFKEIPRVLYIFYKIYYKLKGYEVDIYDGEI